MIDAGGVTLIFIFFKKLRIRVTPPSSIIFFVVDPPTYREKFLRNYPVKSVWVRSKIRSAEMTGPLLFGK